MKTNQISRTSYVRQKINCCYNILKQAFCLEKSLLLFTHRIPSGLGRHSKMVKLNFHKIKSPNSHYLIQLQQYTPNLELIPVPKIPNPFDDQFSHIKSLVTNHMKQLKVTSGLPSYHRYTRNKLISSNSLIRDIISQFEFSSRLKSYTRLTEK